MTSRPASLAARFLAATAAALLAAIPAAAQEKIKAVPFAGTQAFCNILDRFHLAPVPDLASFKQLEPAETLLIVFGDNRPLEDVALDDFRRRGGAVLIASDRDDEGRLAAWAVRIVGEPVSETRHTAYKHLDSCPFIRNLNRRHPLFRGLRRDAGLATNRPGRLRVRQDMPVLARFSANCFVRGLEKGGGAPFLAAAPDVIILAGHSVFINGMIAQPDNDNWTFAWNCVRWLSQGPQGPRKHAFLVEEGRVKQSFDVPLTVSMPRLSTGQMLNGLLRGLESDNFFNRVLLRFVARRPIWRSAMTVVTVVLLFFIWRRLGKSRFRQDTGAPRAALEPAADFALPAPPIQQRQQALAAAGNYWEPGQALARFFFEEMGQPPASAPPAVTIRGSWWRRAAFASEVRRLWQLAYGEKGHLSARAFRRLPARLDRLAQAIFWPSRRDVPTQAASATD